MNSVSLPASEEMQVDRAATMAKVGWRIMPFVFLCYLVNYLDRTNISYAALTMNQDLGIDPATFGWIVGAFFIAYCVCEIPSNLALQRFGARIWIARIMVTWGIATIVCAFVTSPTQLLIARFFLGAAEGGFAPGIFLYLSSWFPSQWRAKAMATFLLGVPISAVIGGPLSSAILSLHGLAGLKQWQWLFLLEGIPAIVLGVFCFFMLVDSPEKAKWLSASERNWLVNTLQSERTQIERNHHMTLRQALTNSRVLLLTLIYLAGLIGLNGVFYWLPQIVKSLGVSNVMVGLITAVPHLVGVAVMVLWARRSDRTGKRTWHVAAGGFFGMVFMAASGLVHSESAVLVMLTLALAGAYAFLAVFWALPSAFLTGRAAAGGFGLILSIGNLSGFFGPYLVGWIKQTTQSFSGSLMSLSLFLLAAGVLTVWFGRTVVLAEEHKG